MNFDAISIKSKIGVEFRRYALKREDVLEKVSNPERSTNEKFSFEKFYKKIESFHQLSAIPFVIFYTDSEDFPLPINNDDNLAKAISSAKHIILNDNPTNYSFNASNNNNNNANNNNHQHHHYYQQHTNQHHHHHIPTLIRRPYVKLYIEKKGTYVDYRNGSGKYKKSQPFKGFSNLILPSNDQSLRPSISMPEDFRQVSSIIDVDIVPETQRRVKIVKHGSDRPLGFYIRDGTYKRMNAQGQMELVTGIFISRLVPGGLAESTGLLAVNDEVLEVNGIQVTHGKTLDQVTDMMVANSSNLIITIRPGKLNNMS